MSEQKVPSTLEECFPILSEMLSDIDRINFVQGPEGYVVTWHHDLGRWIRNNWNLWQGGPLKDHFIAMGIHHPDDMSGIILTSYWRHMNKIPIKLDAQIKYYQDYWAKQGAQ